MTEILKYVAIYIVFYFYFLFNLVVSGNKYASRKCIFCNSSFTCSGLSLELSSTDLNRFHGISNRYSNKGLDFYEVTKPPLSTLIDLNLAENQISNRLFNFTTTEEACIKALNLSKIFPKFSGLRLTEKCNWSSLALLDLSHNQIGLLFIENELPILNSLDLSFNNLISVPTNVFKFMPNLKKLDISGNLIHEISQFSFQSLKNLESLQVNFMPLLAEISMNAFFYLPQLKFLEITNNKLLEWFNTSYSNSPAFILLNHLDLSYNSLRAITFLDEFYHVSYIKLTGNRLLCHCHSLKILHNVESIIHSKKLNLVGFACTNEISDDVYSDVTDAVRAITRQCYKQLHGIATTKLEIYVKIGQSISINCSGLKDGGKVLWLTNRREIVTDLIAETIRTREAIIGEQQLLPSGEVESEEINKFSLLSNGSLFIPKVRKKDGGDFICVYDNVSQNEIAFLNGTHPSQSVTLFLLRLDYSALTDAVITSLLVGSSTSAGFFVAAVILGTVRYACNVCSVKEKKKRRSIREILEKISGFKSAQMDKLSAYKSAKMDQLLALKSATIDHLSAFKVARIDKLRTYKQATMTTILHHMDRMRDHYTTQSSKIKDNCSQQVDRLRETYETGCGRFKDYRSHRVEKMRENYSVQVCRIREYGIQQMLRLREQYKTQQQYLLKLLELIDVGNCVTVIEAECRKTESVIFDADITFDLEPRPIRMPGNLERDIFGEDGSDEISPSEQIHKKEFLDNGFERPKKFCRRSGNNFERGADNEHLKNSRNKDFFVDFVIREAQISSSSDEDDNSSRSYSRSISSKSIMKKLTKDKNVATQEETSIFFGPVSNFAQENFPAFDLPEKKYRKVISSPYSSDMKNHLDYDISLRNCRSGLRPIHNNSTAMKNADLSLSFKDQNFSSSEKVEMSPVSDTGGTSSPSSLSSYNSARAVFDEDFHSVDCKPSSCDYNEGDDVSLEIKTECSQNSEAAVAFEQTESMSGKGQKIDATVLCFKSPNRNPESASVPGCHSKLLQRLNEKIIVDETPKSRMPEKKEKCYMLFVKGIKQEEKIKEGIHGRSKYKVVIGGSKLKESNISSQSK